MSERGASGYNRSAMNAPADPALRQRDYLLGIARAMTEALEPREVMALVLKTAVTMTGGAAGAIAIRGDGRAPRATTAAPPTADDEPLRIVASYHLEAKLVEHLQSALRPAWAPPSAARDGRRGDAVAGPAVDAGALDGGALPAAAAAALALPAADLTRPALPPPAGALVSIRPVAADEAALDVVTLPLRRREHEIGQIVVFRSHGAAVFSSADEAVLRAFADQAAIAIENALLHGRLAAREQQLATVVDGSPTGILLLDADGRIVGANAAAERLLGTPRERLRGRAVAEALPLQGDDGRAVDFALPIAGGDGAAAAGDGAVGGAEPLAGWLADGARRRWVQVAVTGLAAEGEAVGEVDAAGDGGAGAADSAPPDGAAGGGFVVNIVDVTALREAENAKSTFLAGLSHELKTPLALIRGFAETLGQPEMAGDDAFRDEAVGVILDEADHLTRMVDQLLLAARLHAGALPLDRHAVDLAALLERSVAAFRRVHPDRRWRADLADVGPISGDPVRLREVVDNLLSNAVKYSAPDSPIQVVLTDDGTAGGVVLQVIDRGIGIAPADQAQLFGRFYRARPDVGAEGTGLGLYMSRAIVAAHGGRIDVESAPGEGSTFTVRLPRGGADGNAADTPAGAEDSR